MIHRNLIEFYTKFQHNHEQINQLSTRQILQKQTT
jgi:hypothetical protein